MNIDHLPPQPTQFVGRADELAAITRLLTDPACRLLTLVGPGGIGKTRLALEGASTQASRCPDGVYFVPLQPLSSPDLIVPTIAGALGFQFSGPLEPRLQLFNFLKDKSSLLILDNFEHLLGGIDLLAEMLAAAPGLKLLVTSRELLNLREEWRYPLMGMHFPPGDTSDSIEDYDAVRLFEQLARRAQPDFSLEHESIAVVRICQQVEGMPLGIELAASWLKRLPCTEILKEIERGLDILENPAHNVEGRHRSMRVMLEQSWNLLSEDECDALKKLSVFRGGFRKEAAWAVVGASLRTLSALVDKSLLRVNDSGRYDLHELVRQYAEEQLNVSPAEVKRVPELHAMYYADFMEQQLESLHSMQLKASLQAIESDIDNIRSAWRWAVGHRNADVIKKSVASFEFFYDVMCWFDEGARALEIALETLEIGETEELTYAQVLRCYGFFCMHLMRFDQARSSFEESITIFRRLDARQDMAYALGTSASLYFFYGAAGEADRLLGESLTLFKAIDDRRGMAWALRWRANVALWLECNHTSARDFASESVALSREMNELGRVDQALAVLAWCAYYAADFNQAKQLHLECMSIADEFNFTWLIMESFLGLGLSELALGEYKQAVPHCYEGVTRMIRIGNWTLHLMRMVFAEIAPVFHQRGETIKALEYLALALYTPLWDLYPLSRSRGEQFLAQLQAEMMPDEFAAAVQRGQSLDLEAAGASLLIDLQAIQSGSAAAPANPEILTVRELEILGLLADGLNSREIALQLYLSVSTIRWYLQEIYTKLDVHSRSKAIARARELNLLV